MVMWMMMMGYASQVDERVDCDCALQLDKMGMFL